MTSLVSRNVHLDFFHIGGGGGPINIKYEFFSKGLIGQQGMVVLSEVDKRDCPINRGCSQGCPSRHLGLFVRLVLSRKGHLDPIVKNKSKIRTHAWIFRRKVPRKIFFFYLALIVIFLTAYFLIYGMAIFKYIQTLMSIYLLFEVKNTFMILF